MSVSSLRLELTTYHFPFVELLVTHSALCRAGELVSAGPRRLNTETAGFNHELVQAQWAILGKETKGEEHGLEMDESSSNTRAAFNLGDLGENPFPHLEPLICNVRSDPET